MNVLNYPLIFFSEAMIPKLEAETKLPPIKDKQTDVQMILILLQVQLKQYVLNSVFSSFDIKEHKKKKK